MPSKKSHRRQKRNRLKKVKYSLPLLKIIVVILLFLFGYLFIAFKSPNWNGEDKVTFVEQMGEGSVAVKVYDPNLDELIVLIIPGDTEVSVSRNLGTLRLKNVWQLAQNEEIGGDLLAETVTKNFLFPVFLWQGIDRETNVPIGDRLFLWIFEKRTKNLQKTEIDLGKSQFVKRQRVSDGELGYKLVGDISERLTVYFADNDFQKAPPQVYIKDKAGTYGIADNVGKVIEVMGGKIVTIEKGSTEDTDCTVSGILASKISKVFRCKEIKDSNDFDITITLGSQFAKRF